jgi:hypothetical protein
MPTLLSIELLEEFAARLRGQAAPAIEAAQPGLDNDAMQALAESVGLELPVEARTWWGWHNGVPMTNDPALDQIGPLMRWRSLQDAISECLRVREMIASVFRDGPKPVEEVWRSTWLPWIHAEGLYVIETDVPDSAPAPVHVHWFDEPTTTADLPSMGEAVVLWIEAIDRGAWRYLRDRDRWWTDDTILEGWWAAKKGIV